MNAICVARGTQHTLYTYGVRSDYRLPEEFPLVYMAGMERCDRNEMTVLRANEAVPRNEWMRRWAEYCTPGLLVFNGSSPKVHYLIPYVLNARKNAKHNRHSVEYILDDLGGFQYEDSNMHSFLHERINRNMHVNVLVLDIYMKFAGDADERPSISQHCAKTWPTCLDVSCIRNRLRELMTISLCTHSVHNTNPHSDTELTEEECMELLDALDETEQETTNRSTKEHRLSTVPQRCDTTTEHRLSTVPQRCDTTTEHRLSTVPQRCDTTTEHRLSTVPQRCDTTTEHSLSTVRQRCDTQSTNAVATQGTSRPSPTLTRSTGRQL